jgi:hypothetical protein
MTATHGPHTASLRAATGLDIGARDLIVSIVNQVTGFDGGQIMVAFFQDRYGSRDDYIAAVAEVYGQGFAHLLNQAVSEAAWDAEYPMTFRRTIQPHEAAARAFLKHMPEADFRLAIEEALRYGVRMKDAALRISKVCRARGVPWEFDADEGFRWVGDAEVERELLKPAEAALHDKRFAGGVRSEFESARAELRAGTPQALKQAIHEAGCSVESAMKVVLDQRQVPYAPKDAAFRLFERLEAAGVVTRNMEKIVLGAATPRNKQGGHGAGAVAHNPDPAEAESVVASAAGAIAYLHKQLP